MSPQQPPGKVHRETLEQQHFLKSSRNIFKIQRIKERKPKVVYIINIAGVSILASLISRKTLEVNGVL